MNNLVLCVLLLQWAMSEMAEAMSKSTFQLHRRVVREQESKGFKMSWMLLKENYWGESRPDVPEVLPRSKHLWFYGFHFGTWLRFLDFIIIVFICDLYTWLRYFIYVITFWWFFSFIVWCSFASFLFICFHSWLTPIWPVFSLN